VVGTIDHLTTNLADNSELYEMSKADADFDGLRAIESDAARLESSIAELEFRRMFDNPLDAATASSTSRPAPAAPKPATGPPCCCAST
jgi:hypothetical protein